MNEGWCLSCGTWRQFHGKSSSWCTLGNSLRGRCKKLTSYFQSYLSLPLSGSRIKHLLGVDISIVYLGDNRHFERLIELSWKQLFLQREESILVRHWINCAVFASVPCILLSHNKINIAVNWITVAHSVHDCKWYPRSSECSDRGYISKRLQHSGFWSHPSICAKLI